MYSFVSSFPSCWGEEMPFGQADAFGAFDRFESTILLDKCRRAGLHPKLFRLLSSWLQGRFVHVVVGGKKLRQPGVGGW